MSEFDQQESEFRRLIQGLPFTDAARPEERERLRAQMLAKFDEARSAERRRSWLISAYRKGNDFMRRPIPRLIAASVCLTAIGLWLFAPGPQTAHAFHNF